MATIHDAYQFLLDHNFDQDSQEACRVVLKLLDNAILDETKRRVRLQNQTLQKKVASKQGGLQLLLASGFVQQTEHQLLSSTTEEILISDRPELLEPARHALAGYMVRDFPALAAKGGIPVLKKAPKLDSVANNASNTFNPYQGHRTDRLSAAVGTNLTGSDDPNYVSNTEKELQLLQAKQRQLESKLPQQLSRDWLALRPGQHSSSGGVGDGGATSSNDASSNSNDAHLLKQHVQQQMQQQKKKQQFSTKAMRDLEAAKKVKIYNHCTITIQLTTGNRLVGKFLPKERIRDVLEAIRQDCFVAPLTHMELYVTPPRTVLDPSKTLSAQGLVPAAKVFLSTPDPVEIRPALYDAKGQVTFPRSASVAGPPSTSVTSRSTASHAVSSREDREQLMLLRMMGGGKKKKKASGGTTNKPKWFKP